MHRRDIKRQSFRFRFNSTEQLEARILLTGDLVARWSADDLTPPADDAALVWVDSIGGIEANAIGSPSIVADGFGNRPSVRFNPADDADYFSVSKNSSPLSGAEDFSISVVFASDSNALVGGAGKWFENTGIVDANSVGFERDWGLTINASGQITVGLGQSLLEPSKTLASSQQGLNDGDLHVVTISRSGSDFSIFVDDQSVSTEAGFSSTPRSDLDFSIGALKSGGNPFTGDISEVRIFDGALDAAEAQALYAEIVTPKSTDDFYFISPGVELTANIDQGVLSNDIDITSTNLTTLLVSGPQKGELTLQSDGSFVYAPKTDFQSGIDEFTYRAIDGDEQSALTTVQLIINSETDQQKVVISEIHTNPDIDTELVEFIELHNSGNVPVRLAGWYFSSGVTYVFDDDASIDADGYAVVTQNKEAFTNKFGIEALGQWTGSLSNAGETIELRTPSAVLIDRVDYGQGFPWPTVGDEPGFSMELINPTLDNQLGGSWRSSTGQQTVFETGSIWEYVEGTQEPSAETGAWRSIDFNTTAWKSGAMPIGFSRRDPIATELPDMQDNYSTVYLRKTFQIDDPAAVRGMTLQGFYDDGINVWINGSFVASGNTSEENLPFDAVATDSNRATDLVEFDLPDPTQYLVAGKNVIAVQFLNQAINNSDAVFDAKLLNNSKPAAGPTPGFANSIAQPTAPPQTRQVVHTPLQPTSSDDVTITVKTTDPDGVANVSLEYQIVAPGSYIRVSDSAYQSSWTTLPMVDDGTSGDATAGDSIYTAVLSAALHEHRHLMRYRIVADDMLGESITVPYADDAQPNFAYFVYDGIPAWTAADRPGQTDPVAFSSEVMSQLPAYHLIADAEDVQNSQYVSSFEEIRFTGAMVYDGVVYDNIEFGVRGEFSTYVSGKNKWKFFFNRGHEFQARDNYGRPYAEKWRVMNFSSAATPWVLMNRGMGSLGEATAYGLYGLAGNPSPNTNFLQFRVIDDAVETPEDQYQSDLWGLYLAIENPDGNFLNERGLPDGTTYKIESGQGDIKHQGSTQPDARRDFSTFYSSAGRANDVDWWRENVDLDSYYTFRAVNRSINNMDIRDGWNHYMYHNPETNKWTVIPWDLDMLYVPSTHWSGVIRLENALRHDELEIEYQNRARELQDLLFTNDQIDLFVDELASFENPPDQQLTMVDVDRYMWNYNPRSRSGHTGAFDQQSTDYNFAQGPDGRRDMISGDHEGFEQWIKDFMTPAPGGGSDPISYGADFLEREARDNDIPETPTATFVGSEGFAVDDLTFESSAFVDPQGNDTFAAMQWRIAKVTDPSLDSYNPKLPRSYEVQTSWESEIATEFSNSIAIPSHVVEPGQSYRVRVRMQDDTGRWSHWSDAVQFIPTSSVPQALIDGLRISEINYNPSKPTVDEIASGHTDNNDFEFIELINISDTTIDLRAAELVQTIVDDVAQGVEFDFAGSMVEALAPGERVLVVEDLTAFVNRYGDTLPIAGAWSGRLSNSGEQLTLVASGTLIQQFSYRDNWYPSTDGNGFTLEIIDANNQDLTTWNTPDAWQPSGSVDGSPGQGRVVPGDSNFDGIFDSSDLVKVFQAGEYEDDIVGNSTFEAGDWNGDGEFNSRDLVFVFTIGNFVAESRDRSLTFDPIVYT